MTPDERVLEWQLRMVIRALLRVMRVNDELRARLRDEGGEKAVDGRW